MGIGYFNPKGRYVLWAIPERPDGMRNFTTSSPFDRTGTYIFGQNTFKTRNIPITNIFRRKITGGAEEFLLGALSVLLIAVLSEIVQAILMRRRKRKNASKKGVEIAFMVDEFYHFRNVWAYIFSRKSKNRKGRSADPDNRRKIMTSVTILAIAVGLMAADVFAVYLTQPFVAKSRNFEYNLHGFTPTFTNQGLGRLIRRLSRDRPCVTPIFVDEVQQRDFSVSACVTYNISQNDFNDDGPYTGDVKVGSWFHRGGSDHLVEFSRSSLEIKTRTVLYASANNTKRLLYEVIEAPDFRFSRFLHQIFILNAMEVSCNPGGKGDPQICETLVNSSGVISEGPSVRDINLWRSRNGPLIESVQGYETRFRVVNLDRPWASIDNGISPLTSTASVDEVDKGGKGMYSSITTEEFQDNVDELLSEEGRIAGLLALILIFAILTVVLCGLRISLTPTSLGRLAWSHREAVSDTEDFLIEGKQWQPGSSSSNSLTLSTEPNSARNVEGVSQRNEGGENNDGAPKGGYYGHEDFESEDERLPIGDSMI